MRVSVEGGKYTYVITETNAHVLRYGELWKDATGDKFTYSMAAEIESLREQVEKLTKERDELHRAFNQPVPRSEWEKMQEQLAAKDADNKWLRSAVTLQAEQLAALAEQNEKMRKVLLRLACLGNGDQYGNSIGNCIAQEALSLPNLASPVLNKIKAEAYREAADICEDKTTRWEGPMKTAANTLIAAIRARADELEQSNG